MAQNILNFLTISFIATLNFANAQEIWREDFSLPGKGIWGNGTGYIQTDFEGISAWSLGYPNIQLTDAEDYAKTVSTSGGRFEVRDINGEVCWRSEWIYISGVEKVDVRLEASETGSGANGETKYLNAFFSINNGNETPFETNSTNIGNWGAADVVQKNISGDSLQIAVYISNHFSADRVILDEVVVSAEEKESLPAQHGELVINEVLFNPLPGGKDYVEIYNRSANVFPLKDLFLASRDKESQLTQIYSLAGGKYLLMPRSYVAVTKDTSAVFPFYFIECPGCFQQIAKMPSYNNDEDVVVLLNENMEIIDELAYSESLHNPWLADADGVSLERISADEETNLSGNWTSASMETGYGTPGYKNSQAGNVDIPKPHITFGPEAFSPNSDGYNDEYAICYELDKPGYIGNVSIFDSKGRYVMQLAKNEILGINGKINWDGEDGTGQRQPLGVYVVIVEIFNPEGQVFRFKDGVVLTDILE